MQSPHLDPADCFLGLHHAYIFGWSFVWEQLSGAKVIGSKNNSIDQVFRVTRSRDCNTEPHRVNDVTGWSHILTLCPTPPAHCLHKCQSKTSQSHLLWEMMYLLEYEPKSNRKKEMSLSQAWNPSCLGGWGRKAICSKFAYMALDWHICEVVG